MNGLQVSNRHKVFIENVFSGMPLREAGEKAGFTTPERDAYPVLVEETVKRYFKKRVRGRAETEGLTVAYNYMIDLIRDERADRRLRLDAAKCIYTHHMPAIKALEPNSEADKPLAEMTNEELRAFIEKTESELSKRAKDITPPQSIDELL